MIQINTARACPALNGSMPISIRQTDFDQAAFLESGALFVTPEGEAWLFWGEREDRSGPALTGPSLYVPDFFLEHQHPWIRYSHYLQCPQDVLRRGFRRQSATDLGWQAPDQDEFKAYFERIQRAFDAGLNKAVPVVFERAPAELTPAFKEHFIARLLEQAGGQYLYGIWSASDGVWGRSPELLFALREQRLRTMALAGTTRSGTAGALLRDAKECHEHAVVVEDIHQRLSTLGTPYSSETYEWDVGLIRHLRTDIQADHVQRDFADIVETLHPTPALGLFPRHFDHTLLRQLCDLSLRKRFGAPFGLKLGPDEGHCIVAIRNIQASNGELLIGSGCGVLPQSNFESEWQELHHKRLAVKHTLL